MRFATILAVLIVCSLMACKAQPEIEFTVGNERVVVEKGQASISLGRDAANRNMVVITLRNDIAERLQSATSRHVGGLMSLRIGEIFEQRDIPIHESFLPDTLHLAVASEEEARRVVEMWGDGEH
ncbi:hypothetical protein [Desulfomicrobium salsuginis]